MENSVILNRYGLNKFLSKIYLNRIDDVMVHEEYEHTVEIIQGDSFNGNGYCTMKIYTKGNLKELSCGKWKISPIVNMPFCWGGYSDCIEVVDGNGESYMVQITPDKTSLFKKGKDFTLDVKAVYETIYSLHQWCNVPHLRLDEILKSIKEDIELYSFYPPHMDDRIKKAKELCFQNTSDIQFQKIRDQYLLKIVGLEKILNDRFLSDNK